MLKTVGVFAGQGCATTNVKIGTNAETASSRSRENVLERSVLNLLAVFVDFPAQIPGF